MLKRIQEKFVLVVSPGSTDSLKEGLYFDVTHTNSFPSHPIPPNQNINLFVPKPRTNYGKRAVLWNDLPQNVRAICSLSQFKREIDNFFFLENGLLHGNLENQYLWWY